MDGNSRKWFEDDDRAEYEDWEVLEAVSRYEDACSCGDMEAAAQWQDKMTDMAEAGMPVPNGIHLVCG